MAECFILFRICFLFFISTKGRKAYFKRRFFLPSLPSFQLLFSLSLSSFYPIVTLQSTCLIFHFILFVQPTMRVVSLALPSWHLSSDRSCIICGRCARLEREQKSLRAICARQAWENLWERAKQSELIEQGCGKRPSRCMHSLFFFSFARFTLSISLSLILNRSFCQLSDRCLHGFVFAKGRKKNPVIVGHVDNTHTETKTITKGDR